MFRRMIVFALGLVWVATAAQAKSPEQRFEKLISKYAIPEATVFTRFKPRLACFCKDSLPALPGFLVLSDSGHLLCGVAPGFENGELMTYGPCQNFEVLPR